MVIAGEEVRYWFERAVSVRAGNRTAFLESSCSDEAVRSEVRSLLEYDAEVSGPTQDVPIPQAVKDVVGTLVTDCNSGLPAPRAGPFQIGRLLGSGGMGFVYEGIRVDGEVRQRVAVKFAQVALSASQEMRDSAHRRFHRERQMLASLYHPYIASLIDAGTTSDGIPYAVIEQVDGVPIDAYCDSLVPDPVNRIHLILKLCEAVQFAHRNLIVHSDIKPDNVLVTADGIPKLIDFGVGSNLGEEATLTAMRAFTPGYASPEQLRGLPPTVATDVYGIGAVLYRLLTGAIPRQTGNRSFTDVLRLISDEDIVRPSAVKRELKGDLENIILKALHRDPHRRYGSVPELADDLKRFLAKRPVRASPDSTLYRTRQFARRHRVPLAAAAMLVVALVVVTIVSVEQRRHATRRAMETRQLSERLLFEVHDEISGIVGGTKAREKLGSIAVQYLEGLQGDYGRDPELAWELMNAYSRLGQSRGGAESSVGDTRTGTRLAVKTLELGAIVEASASDKTRLDRLFAVYESLVPVFQEAAQPARQREAIDRMLRLSQRLKPIRQAQALKALARYLEVNASPEQAADTFKRALTLLKMLSSMSSRPAGAESQITSTLVGLGRAQSLSGDFSGAVMSLEEAIRRSENSNATDPYRVKTARQLYWSHIALGDTLGSPLRFSLGRRGDAAEHYRKARDIAEALAGADPDNEAAKLDVARALLREAAIYASDQPARSLALLNRSQSLAARTSRANQSALDTLFACLSGSVTALVTLGHFEQAKSNIAQARGLINELPPADLPLYEKTLLRAEAILFHAGGRTAEALAKAQMHLALLPNRTHTGLSESFEEVEVLERIRTYSRGMDTAMCTSTGERLVSVWEDLRTTHPASGFVQGQLARARTLAGNACLSSAPKS